MPFFIKTEIFRNETLLLKAYQRKQYINAHIDWVKKLIEAGSINEAKNKGWLRSEGKDYIVEEGDVMEFLFNV